MNLLDLFESQQQCPECGGISFSDLILAEKKDACYYKVKASAKVWPSAYASGRLVQCRKKGADNYGKSKNEGVAEVSGGQKFIVTYNNRLSNDSYTIMVSADDEYDAKDKVSHALGMGDRITDVKSARGTEPTDREYKVFVDPRTSQKRSGIYDRQQSLAEAAALAEEFDLIESIIDRLAEHNGVAAEAIWEDLESLTDDELYVFAVTTPLMEDWQKANKRDRTDGMSQKAVNAYRRENPGSKLKTAVTTKPSKLKRGSKASKRRSSYCSRSRGQMKMHSISCAKTPDKAICKARRRWNCESVDLGQGMAEARSPEEFVRQMDKIAATPQTFEVGDWVTIDPNETSGYASSGMVGRIIELYDDEGESMAKIAVGGGSGVQTKMKTRGGVFAPSGTTIGLGKGVRSSGTHTAVPTSVLQKYDPQGVAEGYDEDEGNPVMNAIIGRIMRTRPDLLDYNMQKLQAAIRDVALDVGDVDEIGSSDISGWVKRVEQQLSGAGVAESDNEKIAGRYDPEEFDSMVQRLKKLAGAGPMKTVYDPQKRVYRNVPVAQQPADKK